MASLNKKQNILIISDEFPPEGGGAGVIAKCLTLDLVEQGVSFTLVCGSNKPQTDEMSFDVNQIPVRRKTLVWPFYYWRVFRSLDLDAFDKIILNDFVAVYLAGLWFNNKTLNKCVLVVHGNDSKFVFTRETKKHWIFAYRHFYRRSLNHCQRIVAVSNYAKDLYIHFLPEDLRFLAIDVCYAGVSSRDFDLDFSVTRQQLGLPENVKVLFTACRIIEEKGIFNQLDLFESLLPTHPELIWLLAGEGPDKLRFEDEVRKRNLDQRVKLLGFIPRSQLGGYYRLADIFWMLSVRDGETMGLVYLEASLFGTPSIGLRQYGVVEAIKEGKSGYFFDGENIEACVEACLRNDMSESCKAHVKNFESKNFALFLQKI